MQSQASNAEGLGRSFRFKSRASVVCFRASFPPLTSVLLPTISSASFQSVCIIILGNATALSSRMHRNRLICLSFILEVAFLSSRPFSPPIPISMLATNKVAPRWPSRKPITTPTPPLSWHASPPIDPINPDSGPTVPVPQSLPFTLASWSAVSPLPPFLPLFTRHHRQRFERSNRGAPFPEFNEFQIYPRPPL
jgi:hypothetical protein